MSGTAILVVDDDEVLLRACERGIGSEARMFTATTAVAARDVARENVLDAVVVDLRLAAENGIDLVRELKESRPSLKVLLWSGFLCTEETVEAMRAGADDVRHKPISLRSLLKWVESGTWGDPGEHPATPTLERVQWEHARRVVSDCTGNLSEAARRLGIERATLRRTLRKRAPR
ncbi:MAG: response regulator [Myxococcota bacterium]|nr:response regulator [Myxococcota bacterium]